MLKRVEINPTKSQSKMDDGCLPATLNGGFEGMAMENLPGGRTLSGIPGHPPCVEGEVVCVCVCDDGG